MAQVRYVQRLDDVGPEEEPEGALDLGSIIGFLSRQKWRIAALWLAFALASLGVVNIIPPRYVGETVVDPHMAADTGITSSGGDAATVVVQNSPELVRSEIDVVQSGPVIEGAIRSLNLLADPRLNRQGLLSRIFSPPPAGDKAKIQMAIVEQNLLDHLKIDNDGRSYGLHIQYTAENPDKAARIANAIAQEYLHQQLNIRTGLAAKGVQWLNSQLDILRTRANASEAAVAVYKQKHHLFDLGGATPATGPTDSAVTGQTVAVQQLSQLNTQLAVAKANAVAAEARLRAAQENNDGRLSTEVLASPIVQTLIAQEGTVEQQVVNLQTHYGPKYPALIAANDQLSQVREKIKTEANSIIAGISADAAAADRAEEAIEARMQSSEAQASTEVGQRVELVQLQRQADADRQIYEQFLLKQSQTVESAASQVPEPVVVSEALPPLFPAFPKKKVLFTFGTVLGLICAFAIALVIDNWSQLRLSASGRSARTDLARDRNDEPQPSVRAMS